MRIRTIAVAAIVLAASVGAQAQTASKYYMRSQMKVVEAKAASTPPAPPAVTCGAFEEEMWNTSGTTVSSGTSRIFDPAQQMVRCNDLAKQYGPGYCSIYNGDIYYKNGGVKYRQAGRTDLKTATCQ